MSIDSLYFELIKAETYNFPVKLRQRLLLLELKGQCFYGSLQHLTVLEVRPILTGTLSNDDDDAKDDA